MEFPTLKPIKRDPGYPEVWDWVAAKTAVYRPRLCLTFPKARPGALALLLEEAEFRKLKTFHIAFFEEFTHTNHLLGDASEAARQYEVHDVYANLTRPEQDFLRFFNSNQARHATRLSVRPVPHADPAGKISFHLNLLHELTQADRGRCFFPEGSDIPRLLAEIPELPYEATDSDFPGAACVAYGVAALYFNETLEPEASWKKKKWDVWGPLNDKSYDPLGKDDPYMNFDPFKKG
jgi:hypothetical protein